jgi:hypothetical protein
VARYEDDDDEYDLDDQDGSALLKDLRKQLREAKKRDAEREQELTVLRQKTRERELSEVLSAKGLPAKVAKLYSGDATPEAVDAWLQDFGDVFGLNTSTEQQKPDLPAEDVQAHLRIQQAQGTALPATQEAQLRAQIADAKSAEDVIRLIHQGG